MKNLMDFCIGTVGFWAIGYTIMYGDSHWIFYRKSKLVFWRCRYAQFVFSKLYLQPLPQTIVSGQSPKEQNSQHTLSFFNDDRFYLPNFWALGLARRRLVNQLRFIDFAGSTVVHL
jgi:Amt family ammonium transporter